MKKLISLMTLGLALSVGGAYAAGPAAAAPADGKTTQQTKMATCNNDAKDKKGDERKAFMKECLSAKKETTQQSKMTTCNKEAAGKKGDERKKFMSECLKKWHSPANGPAPAGLVRSARAPKPRARNTAASGMTAIRCAASITSLRRAFRICASSGKAPVAATRGASAGTSASA